MGVVLACALWFLGAGLAAADASFLPRTCSKVVADATSEELSEISESRPVPESPMTFRWVRPCFGNASFCGSYILAEGRIMPDSGPELEAFLTASGATSSWLAPANINRYWEVQFHSPGGDLNGALDLGRRIRELRLSTLVGGRYQEEVRVDSSETDSVILVDGSQCLGECALAFLGGLGRSVCAQRSLGIGGIGPADGSGRITEYLGALGFPAARASHLGNLAQQSPGFPAMESLERWRVANWGLPTADWVPVGVGEGEEVLVGVEARPGSDDLLITAVLWNALGGLRLELMYELDAADSWESRFLSGDFRVRGETRVSVDQVALEGLMSAWEIDDDVVRLSLPLGGTDLERLNSGRWMEVHVDMANAVKGIFPESSSFRISLEGFEGAAAEAADLLGSFDLTAR